MPNTKRLIDAESTIVSQAESNDNCAPWIISINQCIDLAEGYAQDIFELARDSITNSQSEQGQQYALQIQQDILGAVLRFAEKIAASIAGLDSGHILDVELLRLLRNNLERRLRLLSVVEPGNQDITPQDLYYLGGHGEARDLELLGHIRRNADRSNHELYQLLEDAEQAIIWRASEKPELRLEALRYAGPEERVWLVSALIERVILDQGDHARPATGGTLETAALALIPAKLEIALVELLDRQDEDLRAEAIYALGEAGGQISASALAALMSDDQASSSIREHAAFALGRIGGTKAVSALLQTARQDKDEWVQLHAVSSLSNLLLTTEGASASAVKELLRGLVDAKDTPPVMREVARQGLDARKEL